MLQGTLAEILGGGDYIDHSQDMDPRAQERIPTGLIRGLSKIRARVQGETTIVLQRKSSPAGDIRGGGNYSDHLPYIRKKTVT